MPTPSSGQISFANLNTEMGRAANTQIDMNWVRNQTHVGGDGAQVMAEPNLAAMRGLTYFKRNYTAPSDRAYLQTTAYADLPPRFIFIAGDDPYSQYTGLTRTTGALYGTVVSDVWLDGAQVDSIQTYPGSTPNPKIYFKHARGVSATKAWFNGTVYDLYGKGQNAQFSWAVFGAGLLVPGTRYELYLF